MSCDDVVYPLCLKQGQTEILRVGPEIDDDGNVASYTGYKARASARRGFGSSVVLWSLTSDAGEITFEDYDDGTTVHPDAIFELTWTTTITKALENPGNRARWDLEAYDDVASPEVSQRIVSGPYDVSLEVTV